MTKKTLITDVTGQDGPHLAGFLLNKDYEFHGLKRRTSLAEGIADTYQWFLNSLDLRK